MLRLRAEPDSPAADPEFSVMRDQKPSHNQAQV